MTFYYHLVTRDADFVAFAAQHTTFAALHVALAAQHATFVAHLVTLVNRLVSLFWPVNRISARQSGTVGSWVKSLCPSARTIGPEV